MNLLADIEIKTVGQLLEVRLQDWASQRVINLAWVTSLYNEQLRYFHKRGKYLFVGSLTFVRLRGGLYIVDGQHRLEMIKRMAGDALDKAKFLGTEINVQIYDVDSHDEGNEIYSMANRKYNSNGNFDENGDVVPLANDMEYSIIRKKIAAYFRDNYGQTQLSTGTTARAPKWCMNDMEIILNKEEIKNKILSKGEMYMEIIIREFKIFNGRVKIPSDRKQKCTDGLYCVYGQTNCKWFETFIKQL